jgi:diadenosine tetraphosphatase ApaH/serine/threonine PP2A family protein phosphatase
MKYIIFSDIHGNIEAYNAVINVLPKEEGTKYFCVGDIVGYGADPIECITATKKLEPVIVCGNHDWACVGLMSTEYFNETAKKAVKWTSSVLNSEHRDYLKKLDLIYKDSDLTLVHGTLMQPESFRYIFDYKTAYQMMNLMETNIGFIGHSHIPGVFFLEGDKIGYTRRPKIDLEKDGKYLINVGSIGQPRDGDWRACFCIWDRQAGTIEMRRVEYDISAAQRKILEAGLPPALAARLGDGR